MTLSRTERFKLKASMLDEMNGYGSVWDLQRKNLLLTEFGFDTISGDWRDLSFEDVLARVSDPELIEMYSVVTGVEQEEVLEVAVAGPGNWKPGYSRIFLSHAAVHRDFSADVADELAVVGIHAFVAHNNLRYSQPWQAQMEQALRSMQAFVAVVHNEFNESAWCQQEVGWALGRRVPRFVVRMGVEPSGFVGHEQWPEGNNLSPRQVALVISTWASSVPELGETMVEGLFAALEGAGNYYDAGATASRIATLSELSDSQWERLSRIYWTNDQLYTGVLPTNALQPFYRRHGRAWPPPRPGVGDATA